ncbi:outer membrane putative beta-barrel porin/alpha-amylase [Neolewinella xylanilytica]|uniref:Outer membrane putative beta-barrel porin/alpha-amylase n=1 Tax=Neolewinella xylanilytica TaxID=1514080 RepID=A0A2S6I6Z4_9BACT|nr:transporter [Neolewinella xylanilytica]PPK87237.1 outer membrane putative beta-barrel porin/alpha-amylase [Neolewinella xylanilytica]
MHRISSLVLALLCCGALTYSASLQGQGCVAIRGGSACAGSVGNSLNLSRGEFNLQAGYRHFRSFRHFRGSEEEANRIQEGTEVVNRSSFLDLGMNYGLSSRWYATAVVPVVFHHRSSMYEHGGNPPSGLGDRHATASSGLADIRLGIGYWLFDPQRHDFNYSIGLGVKLPTGKFDYTDTFYNQGDDRSETLEAVVDQSIQPGDGGTGIAVDVQGFHPLSHSFGIVTNLYYLVNPRETNGVLTRNGRSEFSCPDQFAVRLGAYYSSMAGFNIFLGGRLEGVPANDLVGGSAGYRRPGYAVSAEPGIGYTHRSLSVFASVPVALYRNRTQSFEDKVRTQETGIYTQGDAAFADYLLNIGVAYRFGGQSHRDAVPQPVPHDVFSKD